VQKYVIIYEPPNISSKKRLKSHNFQKKTENYMEKEDNTKENHKKIGLQP